MYSLTLQVHMMREKKLSITITVAVLQLDLAGFRTPTTSLVFGNVMGQIVQSLVSRFWPLDFRQLKLSENWTCLHPDFGHPLLVMKFDQKNFDTINQSILNNLCHLPIHNPR